MEGAWGRLSNEMMTFKKASLVGEAIEWIEESDDEDLSSNRRSACRQALNGGSVSASNGVRLTVGRGWGEKQTESDRYLFWLGEGQEKGRLYLVLGDGMEEAGESEAIARIVEAGNTGGKPSGKGLKTAEVLLQERPILVSKRVGKALGVKTETAMKEVALGVALAISEAIAAE